MGGFANELSQQEIKHGYSLLRLMDHLDRELDLLHQQRLAAGLSSLEGQQLTRVRKSHLRKQQDCIQEMDRIGFNSWLMERQLA